MSAAATLVDPHERVAPLVIVADDDEDILTLVTLRLQRSGYDVVAARDGAQALALAREVRPDLTLLDVAMPNMTGLEVTAALRADPELSYLRIVLLTARATDNDVEKGVAAGADAYITKPFSPQDLAACVESLLV